MIASNDDGVWDNIRLFFRDVVPQHTGDQLRRKMPSCKPFTFSWADCWEGNVVVAKDPESGCYELTGLVDWELAGFYPVWWEYCNAWPLLSDHWPEELCFPEVLEWFKVVHALQLDPMMLQENTRTVVEQYLDSSSSEQIALRT
jgi:hypothetical protein